MSTKQSRHLPGASVAPRPSSGEGEGSIEASKIAPARSPSGRDCGTGERQILFRALTVAASFSFDQLQRRLGASFDARVFSCEERGADKKLLDLLLEPFAMSPARRDGDPLDVLARSQPTPACSCGVNVSQKGSHGREENPRLIVMR